MGLLDRYKVRLYKMGGLEFDEDLTYAKNGKIVFNSPEQAIRWVEWLRDTVGLSNQELIDEVESQYVSTWEGFDYEFDFEIPQKSEYERTAINLALKLAISDVLFSCELCAKQTQYGQHQIVERKEFVGSRSRVISRGLTGGSVTREVTDEYKAYHLRVCPDCAAKEKKKKLIIKILKIGLVIIAIVGFYQLIHGQ